MVHQFEHVNYEDICKIRAKEKPIEEEFDILEKPGGSAVLGYYN